MEYVKKLHIIWGRISMKHYSRTVAVILGGVREKDVVIKQAGRQLRLDADGKEDLEIEGYARLKNGRITFKIVVEVDESGNL